MEGDQLLVAENISKKFCRSMKHVLAYGAADITRDFFGISSKTDALRKGEFRAVDGMSLAVNRGEMVGLIGPNGSGKSTILKMLNGIYMPDSGRIEVKGRVGALIEIGAGFHPQLTGRENVYVSGAVLGMRKKEIDRKFDEIVEFSGVGDFIDSPVKNYSSGMYVRLGFSVAVNAGPDLLLVDEVLAVGDARFHDKCIHKIKQMVKDGAAVLLVTHGGWYLQGLCHRAILIDKGRQVTAGSPLDCYNRYARMNANPDAGTKRSSLEVRDDRPIVISNAVLCDSGGNPANKVLPETPLALQVRYESRHDFAAARFFIRVETQDSFPLYTSHSESRSFAKGAGAVMAEIPGLSLLAGEYCVWIGFVDDNGSVCDETMLHVEIRAGQGYGDPETGVFYKKINWNYLPGS